MESIENSIMILQGFFKESMGHYVRFHKEYIWKSMGIPQGFYKDVAVVTPVAAVAVTAVAVAPVALCLQGI